MKKPVFILVLILILLNLSGCFQNQISSSPNSSSTLPIIDFSNIKMIDNSGWALSNALVLKTSNGGTYWNNVTPVDLSTTTDLSSFFLNKDIGWVAGRNKNDSFITIFKTTNGGSSWTKSKIQAPINPQIYFNDENNGWLLGLKGSAAGYNPVDIYRTDDGGKTWVAISSNIPTIGPKNGIYFKNNSVGWVTGQQPTGKALYYLSKDGGQFWQTEGFQKDANIEGSFATTNHPIFVDKNIGYFPVNYDGPNNSLTILYTTKNGGESWIATTPIDINANCFFAISNYCWVSNGKVLYRSNDYGKTWSKLSDKITSGNIYQLNFINSQVGWAIGQGIFKTTDGGTNWTEIQINVG